MSVTPCSIRASAIAECRSMSVQDGDAISGGAAMSAEGARTLALHERTIGGQSWAGPLRGLWRFARRKPLGFLGLVLVAVFIAAAVFAPLIAPYDYKQQQLRRRLEPPSREHILGTDSIGRDVFSRLVYGARVSGTVGFGAVLITGALASTIGIVSGYFGGWFDKVVQRIVE